MYSAIAIVAALASTAAASSSVGAAIVLNSCDYDVYVDNTPAADGGYDAIDTVLSSGDTYEQTWTELSNGDGWSIKLSNSSSLANIMQYEYTFQDDGIIWYDLSDVNGNPWNGNWEITATSASSTCDPKQQAYRYSTDDAYGMQACPQDAYITVTLCSGDSDDDGSAASASSSVAAESTATTASSTFSTPSSTPATSSWYDDEATSTTEASSTASQTTFSTATSSAASVATTDAAVVTEVATAVVTDIVTATHYYGRHDKRAHGGHAHHWA